MAADAGPGHAGVAGVVCLGAPARCRPAVGGAAPARRRGHRPATGAAHGAQAGTNAERDGFTPGGLGATRHHTGSHRVAAGRRPAPVSGALARGTGVETEETVAPARSNSASTPHPCRRYCTGAAHGLGLTRRGDGHDPGAPAHRHAHGSSAGQELVADRLRPRYPAAARLWHVVASAGAHMRATLASLCGAQPAPPRASGNDHTGLAYRSRARVARHRAGGGMKGARVGNNLKFAPMGADPSASSPLSSAQPAPQPAMHEVSPPQVEAAPGVPPTPDAERRQLTVMFCDLVDSTRLASQLDPEEYRDVVRAYQRVCSEVITRFDGHLAQLLGDGLLVYFGYPHAHEDDARRAVCAGLGMLAAMEELHTRLKQDKGIPLAVRVGIHTGLVVIGAMGGGGSQEQLALGE